MITFNVVAHTVPWERVGVMCNLRGWKEPLPLNTSPDFYSTWTGRLRLEKPSLPGSQCVDYKYVVLSATGDHFSIKKWEDGVNRTIWINGTDTVLEVHDGEVFGPNPRVVNPRIWKQPACLTAGMTTLLVTPMAPVVTLINGNHTEDEDFFLSVTESSPLGDAHIKYVSNGDNRHVWTNRGALKVGCSWLVSGVADPRAACSVNLSLFRGVDDRLLGEGQLLYGSWTRDAQAQRVGIFSNGWLVAEVHLYVVVASAFQHSDKTIVDALNNVAARHHWGDEVGVPLFHRGAGPTSKMLGAAENTMLAFELAHRRGARWIEFDVQLLRDNTPILFHDVDVPVAKGGIHTTMLQLTPKQVSAIAPGQLRHKRSGSDPRTDLRPHHFSPAHRVVHEPFPTLKQVLLEVHESISFDLEVKYAEYPHEEPFFIDRNDYVDHILACVGAWAGKRTIYFCSFDPDICFLLAHKQSRYQVLFLTESGRQIYPHDPRKNSFDAAFQWARTASLDGIVSDAGRFMEDAQDQPITEIAQQWCEKMRQEGMLLFTYGGYNNRREGFALQKKIGVHGICCDIPHRMTDL